MRRERAAAELTCRCEKRRERGVLALLVHIRHPSSAFLQQRQPKSHWERGRWKGCVCKDSHCLWGWRKGRRYKRAIRVRDGVVRGREGVGKGWEEAGTRCRESASESWHRTVRMEDGHRRRSDSCEEQNRCDGKHFMKGCRCQSNKISISQQLSPRPSEVCIE